jgi:organic hydroperoxide reductase OsmC/OhrA
MGFGGGEALCLTAGACFYNNLHREAAGRGVALEVVAVDVMAVWDDDAPGAQELVIRPRIEAQASQEVIEALIQQALAVSFVANTLKLGAGVRLDNGF